MRRKHLIRGGVAFAIVAVAILATFLAYGRSAQKPKPNTANRLALGKIPAGLVRGHIADAFLRNGREHGPKVDPDAGGAAAGQAASAEQQNYANAAYPFSGIGFAQVRGAQRANERIQGRNSGSRNAWQEIGPYTLNVDKLGTQTGNRDTQWSGRVTQLAIAPRCSASGHQDGQNGHNDDGCTMYVAAAGGGIWRSDNALDRRPEWRFISAGIPSTSIGALLIDPTDRSGRTIYAGTGEESGSSDSEAGVGLYKSTNAGRSWTLVPGSLAVANNRSIGAIAVDPANRQHIFIGTDVARHGASSVNGGRMTPPGAPPVGLYETKNGGTSFTPNTIKDQDPVIPSSPNGSDFFRGGVTKIEYDPTNGSALFFSMTGYGLYRSTTNGAAFERIYTTEDPTNLFGIRYEFDAVRLANGKTRIYLGDGRDEVADADGVLVDASRLYRINDASVPAATLTNDSDVAPANPGWTSLSSPNEADPGFGSFDFCEGQCSYDMFVASPPGRPDEVWLGGSMQYGELPPYAGADRSDGRAVVRSTDSGVNWTDMTGDARTAWEDQHPDTRDVAFVPGTNVAFVGSDGGVIRTSGTFSDASAQCDTRGLTGLDLSNCKKWLSGVPTRLIPVNSGLRTLQFESLSANPQNPANDVLGGTQDNGTMQFTGSGSWFMPISGDGGNSGIDVAKPNLRYHTYYGPQGDVNNHFVDPEHWDWIMDPLIYSGEGASFYVPFISDPKVSKTAYTGANHVWRTKNGGGDPTFLDNHCYTNGAGTPRGDMLFTGECGDWVSLGKDLRDASFGTTRRGSARSNYAAQTTRAKSDTGTLWAATRLGRVFITKNADAGGPLTEYEDPFGAGVKLYNQSQVQWTRIDDGEAGPAARTPQRFPSGIAVDPNNSNHAIVSYSGYDAYAVAAGTPTGHVFDVRYNPTTGTATWTNITHDLGDQPITNVEYDGATNSIYASTDFGVLRLKQGSASWVPAANGLPPVAVYDVSLYEAAHGKRVLLAATHGRGGYRLILDR
ncbi:MAG: hypothetical protein M3R70_12560 [Actinomycetota bacterium]|nr:hypothetical protein [Actinomycetota bacterium]